MRHLVLVLLATSSYGGGGLGGLEGKLSVSCKEPLLEVELFASFAKFKALVLLELDSSLNETSA